MYALYKNMADEVISREMLMIMLKIINSWDDTTSLS